VATLVQCPLDLRLQEDAPMQLVPASPEIRTVPSSCPLDCPDACSLQVTVHGGRVVALDGDERNPVTRGFICAKVRRFARHLYSAERLLYPAVRDGAKGEGRFRRVTWDEALSRVAASLDEVRRRHGGEAILPYFYGGSNGFLSQGTTDARLFGRLGASQLERTVCAAPSAAAAGGMYGKMPGTALQDAVHARLIVLWGVNPSASGIHLVPFVQQAREQGAALVVIDPRRTPLARQADLHLAVKPGTDVALALALIGWLFREGKADLAFLERHATGVEALRQRAEAWPLEKAAAACGVDAADVERFARLYAEASPAWMRCGWGLERNRNGGSAVAAVLALPAVAGKFGVRGGGYTMSNSGAWRLDLSAAAAEPAPETRRVNMVRLGEALLEARDPRVHLLFVYNSNALATTPDQERVRRGLLREDLTTVVFEQVLTDTARYADVLLPATTFLERRELARGYGALVLHESAPAIQPVGEARSNHEVFAELLGRLGLAKPDEPETAEELSAAILGGHPRGAELRAALDHGGVAFPDCGSAPVQFIDTFPLTPDGKIHLVPEALEREAPLGLYGFQPDPATERFPLALISPATGERISSTFGQLHGGQVPLLIHPEDAAPRGIDDGAAVRVYNELGEVLCRVRVGLGTRPGVVSLPKGLWSHNTLNGSTSNALSPATLSDLGAGACFNDARVEVECLQRTEAAPARPGSALA
jgi:anaerobic selenocysteine-containing dehydrogenase